MLLPISSGLWRHQQAASVSAGDVRPLIPRWPRELFCTENGRWWVRAICLPTTWLKWEAIDFYHHPSWRSRWIRTSSQKSDVVLLPDSVFSNHISAHECNARQKKSVGKLFLFWLLLSLRCICKPNLQVTNNLSNRTSVFCLIEGIVSPCNCFERSPIKPCCKYIYV